MRWLIRNNPGQTSPLSWRQLGLAKYPMEHYLENPSSLNPEELAGAVFVYSGRHEPLRLELGKTLRAETTEGGAKRETGKNSTTTNTKKAGRPKSKNAFWRDLTATGGDVEVDEREGGSSMSALARCPTRGRRSERV